jgi:quinol monooxygenase YgiN
VATLELVIYTVKPELLGGVRTHNNRTYRALSQWDGFLSGATFQSLENANTFVDYYLWSGLEQARKAAERIKSAPEARDFLDCISGTIVFQHFEAEGDPPTFTNTDEGDVFEVAISIVDPARRETYKSVKPELMALVRQEEGFLETASFEAETGEGLLCFDIMRWQSPDAAAKAMENIHNTEQCGLFMETFIKTVFFDHVRLLPKTEQAVLG